MTDFSEWAPQTMAVTPILFFSTYLNVLALKPIQKGEELTLDYKLPSLDEMIEPDELLCANLLPAGGW